MILRRRFVEAYAAARAAVPEVLCTPSIHGPSPYFRETRLLEVRTAMGAVEALANEGPDDGEQQEKSSNVDHIALDSAQGFGEVLDANDQHRGGDDRKTNEELASTFELLPDCWPYLRPYLRQWSAGPSVDRYKQCNARVRAYAPIRAGDKNGREDDSNNQDDHARRGRVALEVLPDAVSHYCREYPPPVIAANSVRE